MMNPTVNPPPPHISNTRFLSPHQIPHNTRVISQTQPNLIPISPSRSNLSSNRPSGGLSPHRVVNYSSTQPIDVNLNLNVNRDGSVFANTNSPQIIGHPHGMPNMYPPQGIPVQHFSGPLPPQNHNSQPIMLDPRNMNGEQYPTYPFMLLNGTPMPMNGQMFFPPATYYPTRRGVPRKTKP